MRKHVLLNGMHDIRLFLSTLVGENESMESGLADGKVSQALQVYVDCQWGLALKVEVLVQQIEVVPL